MSEAMMIKIIRDALFEVLIVSSPILGVGMLVGIIVSIFQATTSIQEQTLTFVPKIVSIFFAIIIFSSWLYQHIKNYTENLFQMISTIGS